MVSGVPTIGLAYQPKFFGTFIQLAFEDRCFDIESFDAGSVSDQIHRILVAGSEGRAEVVERVDRLSSQILTDLTTLQGKCRVSQEAS
jgi:polysaccharide pyruvyl transferase WcaK-like protein